MTQANLLFSVVIAAAVSMAIIPVMWWLAPRLGLIDEPSPRKIHTQAIPRIGGCGIVAGGILPVVLLLELDPLAQSYILGSLILFVFGLWDDARNIGHYKKFLGQFIAVGVVVFHGDLWIHLLPFLGAHKPPVWFLKMLTMLAMVGMINAMNHSDGLDGLAGGESLLSLLVITFLADMAQDTTSTIIATAAVGGLFGFLRYNTHPARVFMGDTGSQFLGFTLGFLAVLITRAEVPTMSPSAVLLFLGLPVIDILVVLFLRIKNRMNWFRATRNHIHHRVIDLGFDHYETVVMIYSVHAILVTSAIFLRHQNDDVIVTFYLAIAALTFASLSYAEHLGWRRGRERISLVSAVITSIRGAKSLLAIPFWLVLISVPVFLVGASFWIKSVPWDFGIISSILFLVLVIGFRFWDRVGGIATRGAIYATIIFIVYLSAYEPGFIPPYFSGLDTLFFLILGVCVGLAIRFRGEFNFRVSPLDYLNLLGILTILLFGGYYLQNQLAWIVVVKAIILIYGCEMLISSTRCPPSVLKVTSITTLGVLALRGLIL